MAFSQEIADRICERLAAGESLRKACKSADSPDPATVLRWADDKANPAFSQQYAEARARGYQLLSDEIIEISDDSAGDTVVDVARSKLRVDSRKWMLSKMLPKVYGDKLDVTMEVNDRASILRKKREERLSVSSGDTST